MAFVPRSCRWLTTILALAASALVLTYPSRAPAATNSQVSPLACAPNGSLDTTFDTDGKVTLNFSGDYDSVEALIVQPDGKIIAVGQAISTVGQVRQNDFALARFQSNGVLDTSFGTNGRVITDFSGGNEQAFAAALQADGKIVSAGVARTGGFTDFGVARYNPDGTLDTTFGTGGKVTIDLSNGGNDDANAIVIQPDGNIVIAGTANRSGSTGTFGLVRLTTTGALDPTFDTDGKVTTAFTATNDQAHALALQSDGQIVAAGFSGNSDFAVARYTTTGALDPTFDTDGKATATFSESSLEQAFGMLIQPDGKIVIVGRTFTNILSTDFGLARFTTTGALDSTFGTDGTVTTDISSVEGASAVALQSDGKLVVAGVTNANRSLDFTVLRYTTMGELDSSFDVDGLVTTDFFGLSDDAYAMAVQPDGQIIVAGQATNAQPRNDVDFALARYSCGTAQPGGHRLNLPLVMR